MVLFLIWDVHRWVLIGPLRGVFAPGCRLARPWLSLCQQLEDSPQRATWFSREEWPAARPAGTLRVQGVSRVRVPEGLTRGAVAYAAPQGTRKIKSPGSGGSPPGRQGLGGILPEGEASAPSQLPAPT